MVDGPSEAWVDGTSDAAATSSSSPKADEIQGIVVARRVVSRRLGFFDIDTRAVDGREVGLTQVRVHLDECAGAPDRAKAIHVGSLVHLRGEVWPTLLNATSIVRCDVLPLASLELRCALQKSGVHQRPPAPALESSAAATAAVHEARSRVRASPRLSGLSKKAPKRIRGEIFVEWLVRTFGAAALREGDVGVLDIAGGSNAIVAGPLLASYAINVVTVDPSACRYVTFDDPQPPAQPSAEEVIAASDDSATPTPPTAPTAARAALAASGAGSETHHLPAGAHRVRVVSAGRFVREQIDLSDKGATYSHVSERFDSRFAQRSEQHGSLLARCTCIVGLHPDSATVPIVETALALGKPFAVVPCCVFLGDSGAPTAMATRSWDDYCAYLLRKAPPGTIAEAYLPMCGRNRVLYSMGAHKTTRPPE